MALVVSVPLKITFKMFLFYVNCVPHRTKTHSLYVQSHLATTQTVFVSFNRTASVPKETQLGDNKHRLVRETWVAASGEAAATKTDHKCPDEA